jgi:asparagine synthase (glutamine-hydrolysing)
LICWAVAKLGGDITSYTIGTPGHAWDETEAARNTARTLGIRHQVLTMDDTLPLDTTKLASAYAEPFACASALGMLTLSRAMASSVKVMLTGDGGDDVFLGYPPHRHLWLAENLSRLLPLSVKASWLTVRSKFPRVGPLRRAGALFDYTAGGLGALVSYSNSLPAYKVEGLIGDRLWDLPDFNETCWTVNGEYRMLQEYLAYLHKHWFISEFMTKVDGATMHYGLEARSPFLDQYLWEFTSSLPFGLRLHGGRLKAILRELAKRHIGWNVANRRKKGFGIPVQRWIVARWHRQVEAVLRDSILEKEGWIHSGPALAQLNLATRNGWAPQHLWYIFVLESWLRYETLRSNNIVDNAA